MDNVLQFPIKTHHRQLANQFESENYVCFWFDENNGKDELYYRWGKGMTLAQMSYLLKTLSIIVTNTIKEEVEKVDS